MTASIYVCHFLPAQVIETSTLKPIQCGRARASARLDMIGDDTGCNISEKNASYCELTAIYWAWKNDTTSSHIGFCHYRRFFDFKRGTSHEVDIYYVVRAKAIDAHEYGLDDQTIQSAIDQSGVILPEPADFRTLGYKSVRDQYSMTDDHYVKDLDKAGTIISELFPEYSASFDETMEGHLFYANLMFVLPRATFHRFCAFVFPVLAQLEKDLSLIGRSPSGRRALGYVGERLFNVFIAQERKVTDFAPTYLRRVLIENTTPLPILQSQTSDLPIVSLVANEQDLASAIIHPQSPASPPFNPLRIFRPIARLVWRALPSTFKKRARSVAHRLSLMLGGN